jgi:hypothetical protein
MGVNVSFMIFVAAASEDAYQAAVDDLMSIELPDGDRTLTYAELIPPFKLKILRPEDSRVVGSTYNTHRLVVLFDLMRDIPKVQERHPHVFIAMYSADSDNDDVGMIMTGIYQWGLVLADRAAMERVHMLAYESEMARRAAAPELSPGIPKSSVLRQLRERAAAQKANETSA